MKKEIKKRRKWRKKKREIQILFNFTNLSVNLNGFKQPLSKDMKNSIAIRGKDVFGLRGGGGGGGEGGEKRKEYREKRGKENKNKSKREKEN